MQSNYKRLGDYIQPIKERNTDLKATKLLGINIDKFFMPSVANVVGTDMSRYKVVRENQFACNRMHVGRDYRIPIALSKTGEVFMVSPAYDVFEIVDAEILNPEYLMMWFSRKEFDRNAWFYTDADVRGGLSWKAFCDMKLPIPSIEKQNAIVKEYNTVVNSIKLNEQLNQKLEETAQALYKHWFVDFEFPNPSTSSGQAGKPYKSSGGKMVYNEVLEKDIPVGWKDITIKEFSKKMRSGGTPNRAVNEYWNSASYPWLKTGELKNSVIIDAKEYISELGLIESSAKLLPLNSVLIAMYGQGDTKGQVGYLRKTAATNQACCAMICENKEKATFLYYHLRVNRLEIVSIAIGGAQPNLSKAIIEKIPILEIDEVIMNKHPFVEILNSRESLTRENYNLIRLKELLLSKMSKL